MKKVFLLALIVGTGLTSKAQIWFDAGLKGGYTPGIVINKNVFSNDDYKLKYAGGYTFGGKIGVNFSDEHSVTVDFMYSKLGFKTDFLGSEYLLSQNGFQLPILYRKNSDNGGYGEIGPQISFHNSATMQSGEAEPFDVSNQFKKTSYGIVVGGGQYIGGGDVMGITLGIRLAYNFTDMTNDNFKTSSGNAVYTSSNPLNTSDFSYASSNQFYAGFIMEINFNVGYIMHGSGCKKGSRFKLF